MHEDQYIPLGYERTARSAAPGFRIATGPEAAPVPGLIRDHGEGGLVTIAGTGAGKGVSLVIPTALTYPGSMVILDIKGEIAAVTANARRQMDQEVVILDPFGGSQDALNPMEAIEPASIDAPDQCRRLARMICSKRSIRDDPFWDETAETIITGSLLFLAVHIPRKDRHMGLLHRMWGVADHLNEMLAVMQTCEAHGGAMMAAAKLYTDAPEKTSGSILTTLRQHLSFLASPRARASLSGGWGIMRKIRERTAPITVYLRVPPHMLSSHGPLLRAWLGTLIQALAERPARPEIPDLLLVDEAAMLGYLDELLTASSLLRGYGVRTWTFWQSLAQLHSIYGDRAGEILDNASTLTAFGASHASNAHSLSELTGYAGPILGMPRDGQVLCRAGEEPRLVTRLNYLHDPVYQGLYEANPFHASKPTRSDLEVVA